MGKNNWPKRQGNINAIFLADEKNGAYQVFEQDETSGPWFEGSVFRAPESYEQKQPVDNHLFVYCHYTDGNGDDHLTLIGVAHNKSELSDKIYEHAVNYCKKIAKAKKGQFIDQTSRAKMSALEQSAQSRK